MNDEKEIKNYRERIRSHIKKNKRFYTWLFIFLILPLFVECVIYFIEKGLKIEFIQAFKKIFYILREYKSYYATILTLSFAIFSYNKQQEKLLEERQKENELKEKELEAKRDYYRPIFVIETDKDDSSKKQVKLLMKDDSLYLERVGIHCNLFDIDSDKCNFKSGDIIHKFLDSSFYITAQTLIGETILFGYLAGGKVYKYLKDSEYPDIPYAYDVINQYNQNKINSVWGAYNTTFYEYNSNLDPVFFYSTYFIRASLVSEGMDFFKFSLKAETTTEFFRIVFIEMDNLYASDIKKKDVIYNALKKFIKIFNENKDYLYMNKKEYREIGKHILNDNLPDELKLKIKDLNEKICSKNFLENSEDLKNIEECINLSQKEDSSSYLTIILYILNDLFYNIEFDSAMNIYLLGYKVYILNLTFKESEYDISFLYSL